ncbi:uncharacterized protein AB675_9045 [Cyphellophora attinorum]|uniref:Uncharacterized protein n=1 Tax=Cyphellophora attinorum TaxID=1664694 RepID=A0A0N0NNQ9_9EURO|nr:uncharacterized protein AB675_9045 [Phialophora attinorum]KPI41669.1 hypothetical protein AB675_9045 [Phialophora attinorum]
MHFKFLSTLLFATLVAVLAADAEADSWPSAPVSTIVLEAASTPRGNELLASETIPKPRPKACRAKGQAQQPLPGPSEGATGSGHSSGGDEGHSGPGPGGGWQYGPGSSASDAPMATLLPKLHWTQDQSDLDHVRPSNSRDQYYMPDGAGPGDAHQFGWVKADYVDNAVMLDHSNLFTWNHDAASENLAITFKNPSAFQIAHTMWHSGMIFTFYDGSCGPALNCYIIAQDFAFDESSQKCSVTTKSANFDEVCENFEFQWGNYKPGHGPKYQLTTTSLPPSSTTYTASTTSSSNSTPSATPTDFAQDFGFNPDDVNCTAPKDNVYNLPTACLGQYFDDDLDETYGLIGLEASPFATFATQFPGLFTEIPASLDDDEAAADSAALGLTRRMTDHQRRLFAAAWDFFGLPSKDYNVPVINKQISLNVPQQKNTVPSPWGPQVLIASYSQQYQGGAASGKINLFCVDCGASGTADIAGSIVVNVPKGITSVKAELGVNLAVGIKIGLEAEATYTQTINQKLFEVGLPGLDIGIARVGPILRVGADVILDLKAQGTVLGGGTFSITDAKASIDAISLSGTSSGWNPSFNPVFEAQGSIAASAELGLPIELALGVSVGVSSLSFSAGVSVVERPAIVAKAQASATANLNGAGFVSVDGCTGISAGLTFKNNLYALANAGSFVNRRFDLNEVPEISLVSTCIGLPPAPPAEKRADDLQWVSRRQTNNNSTGPIIDTTAQTLANATLNTTTFVVPDSNDLSYNRTDGYYVSTLVDSQGSVQVYSCSDGNSYVFKTDEDTLASDCITDFIIYPDPTDPNLGDYLLVTDGAEDVFVYYPDEMSAVGVSRIRTLDRDSIPRGSEEIVWVLAATAPGSQVTVPVYYPVDRLGNTFYPVACKYTAESGIYDRMFLVRDPVGGVNILTQQNIKYSITGGDVQSCDLLPLIDGASYGRAEENGGLFVYDTD